MTRTTRQIQVGNDYEISVENGEYFVIDIGFTAGHRSEKFTHPNIARTVERVLEFKRYDSDGSKHWESKTGGSHFFVVPQRCVEFLLEKGYSYVKAKINGAEVTFNVSGGTGGNGWHDYVGIEVNTCVNLNIADLKAIAEVAVRGTAFEPIKTGEEITEEFYAANKGKYLVTAAWGDWQGGVPIGMVGVVARIGGWRATTREGEKWFLVPKEEYDERGISFVVDPSRHLETNDFSKYPAKEESVAA